ncbi:MAG: GYDIA family GHMP kinase [Saprospiraceae bacterium]
MKTTLHARGKLLLTAEYFVLDGALALALPLEMGQSMTLSVQENSAPALDWQSFNEKGECWFSASFDPQNFDCTKSTDAAVAARLRRILCEAKRLNPNFTLPAAGCKLRTDLTFPREWGLGTSSTLIHLVAQWAGVDPFELQFRNFGGSGYDVACAGADGPILYQLKNGKPHVEPCRFSPPFSEKLFFVYLGKKQNSRKGIARFRNWKSAARRPQFLTGEVSVLTRAFLKAGTLEGFDELIRRHEKLVAEAIGLPRAKDLYFQDFWGEIKSLGAWGGDFVLATSAHSSEETQRYFNEKGFGVFLPYNSMVIGK